MTTQQIHDRGRGPEISGTRITVFTLLPHFLDPDMTEADICRLYDLEVGQVAAARAYVLNNPEIVLGQYLRIDARLTGENPPEVVERARATRESLVNFKEWLSRRVQVEVSGSENGPAESGKSSNFKQWLAERESRPREGS